MFPLGQLARQVHDLAINLGGDGSLGEALTDALGNQARGGTGRDLLGRAVRKSKADHVMRPLQVNCEEIQANPLIMVSYTFIDWQKETARRRGWPGLRLCEDQSKDRAHWVYRGCHPPAPATPADASAVYSLGAK